MSVQVYHMNELGGRERRFYLQMPTKFTGPVPLVIELHGRRTSARRVARSTGFSSVADAEGFAVVSPCAIRGTWNSGRRRTPSQRSESDDVAFIASIVDRLAEQRLVDRARVFVVGSSDGAFMTHRL